MAPSKRRRPSVVDETTALLVADTSESTADATTLIPAPLAARRRRRSSAVEETTAMFVADTSEATPESTIPIAGDTSEESSTVYDDDDRPLPKFQIAILCYARFVEPVAFFSIFPFINQMIYETGTVDTEDVGYWSGLIESLFSLTQTLFMLSWAHASDKYGRKPVLIVSLVGVSIASALFGFSRTIWQMMALRSIAGVFAGTLVTVRAMFSENSTPKTQARAFSFFAFAGNVGITVGPLIGGGLSNPTDQYPAIFGSVELFRSYPYLLPCIASGLFAASGALISVFFLNETLPPFLTDDSGAPPKLPTMRESLTAPGVPVVMLIYQLGLLLGLSYTAVIPVYLYTDVKLGGAGFNPTQISLWMAASGACQALWLLLAFPILQNRYGTGDVLRLCGAARPIVLALLPLQNAFLRSGNNFGFWIVMPIIIIIATGVTMIYTGVQLILNDISPSPAELGTLNGVALALSSAVRAFAPAIFTSIFAIGIRYQYLHGYLVFVVLILSSFVFSYSLAFLPEKAEGRLRRRPVVTADAE